MIHYLLHASILIAGSYLIYFTLIKNETFFKLNRMILLAAIMISVSLPLLKVPPSWSIQYHKTITAENSVKRNYDLTNNPTLNSSEIKANDQAIEHSNQSGSAEATKETSSIYNLIQNLNSIGIWWSIYLAGVIIFVITFLVQLFIIIAKSTILEHYKDGKYRIVELNKEQAPFSFWNTIFINPTLYDEETYQQILEHEKIHIRSVSFYR